MEIRPYLCWDISLLWLNIFLSEDFDVVVHSLYDMYDFTKEGYFILTSYSNSFVIYVLYIPYTVLRENPIKSI